MAFFWSTGRVHWLNGAFDKLAMTDANTVESFLTSQLGTGSEERCFAGAFFNTVATFSGVTGLNCVNGSVTGRSVIVRNRRTNLRHLVGKLTRKVFGRVFELGTVCWL